MDVGVIGVGAMGKNHVRVYSELKRVDSLGIYDVNTQAAKMLWVKNTMQLSTNRSANSLTIPMPSVLSCQRSSTQG